MDTRQLRTWAQVDLGRIEHNYRTIRAGLGGGVRVLGVVKADAYGHGAVPVAGLLQRLGCEYLAVATLNEAEELRNAGITLPILILGWTDPALTKELLLYRVTQAVSDPEAARAMSEIASREGRTLRIHLKADSGMGRLGFVCRGRDPVDAMAEVMALPGLETEGIFTHFAVSEDLADPYTREQFEDFTALCDRLETRTGRHIPIRHCANSGAVLNCPWAQLDMVRPGILLYGISPGGDARCDTLQPAMSLQTRIVQLKDLAPGDSVSYGRTYRAAAPRRMAVIPVGYADGLHRVLSGRFSVLVRGRRAPQIGNICMDMCMLDVTDVPDAAVGDVVTVFGSQGDRAVPVEELASIAGTIPYELLCAVSKRIPRIYL